MLQLAYFDPTPSLPSSVSLLKVQVLMICLLASSSGGRMNKSIEMLLFALISRTTNCFDELNSSLLCEMLPITQLTPVTIVYKMKECHLIVTLATTFLFIIVEL